MRCVLTRLLLLVDIARVQEMCAASNDAEVTITIAMPIVFGALCLILMVTFVYRGFPSRRADTGGEGNGAHQPSSETAPGGGQSGTSGSGSSATVHPVSGGSKDSDASENDQQLTANKEGSADSNSAMEQDVKDPPPKKQYGKRAKPASEIEAPTSASTALETAGTGQRVVGGIGGSVVALLKLLLNLVQVLNAIAPTYGKDRILCRIPRFHEFKSMPNVVRVFRHIVARRLRAVPKLVQHLHAQLS